jgi:hypothetical protein
VGHGCQSSTEATAAALTARAAATRVVRDLLGIVDGAKSDAVVGLCRVVMVPPEVRILGLDREEVLGADHEFLLALNRRLTCNARKK